MAAIPRKEEAAGIVDGDFVAASAGGDTLANDAATVLYAVNEGPDDLTIVAAAAVRCDHGFLDSQSITVAAGGFLKSQRMPVSRFGPSVALTYPGGVLGLRLVGVIEAPYKPNTL